MKIKPLWKLKEEYRTLKRRVKVMKLIYEGKPVLFGAHVTVGTGMDIQHMNLFENYIAFGKHDDKPSIIGSRNE